VLTATSLTVQLWQATSPPSTALTLATEGQIYAASFSPDGTRVVTASGEQVFVWDVPQARKVASMRADDPYPPISVEVTPDGTHVLAVYFGDTSRVWHVATQANVSAFATHRHEPGGVQSGWETDRHRDHGRSRAGLGRRERQGGRAAHRARQPAQARR